MSESRRQCCAFRAPLWVTVCFLVLLALPATASANQDNPHGEIALDCSECHTTEGWSPIRESPDFDHAETGFDLRQGHADADCVSCHESLIFSFVPTACVDCHRDPHRGELGFDCEACHSPSSWDNRRAIWDVHGATLFPLTGVHATLDCAACHRRQAPFEYALTPTECFTCHVEDYQRADDPNHVAAGFPTECQVCHNTMEWDDAEFEGGFGFDHSALFQLSGAHASLDCEDCHANGFGGTPSDCVGCHLGDYQATTDPNHQQAGIGTTCENCHGTSTWEGAVVEHPFLLTGSHRALDCEDCHIGGVFAGTSTDCVGCHRADYNATTNPQHAQAGIGTNCEDCHGTSTWEGAVLDHPFALIGTHKTLDCEDCHINGVFAGTPTDCVGCHLDDYNATTDPNHQQAGFGTQCDDCHGNSTWFGAVLDHPFALTGAHTSLDCEDCHINGVFAGTPTDCVGCHRDDYDATTDPNHVQAGFPTDCEECHTTSTWEGAEVDHNSFWPLTGAHRNLDCEACHANGFSGTPTDCYECHSGEYNGTTDPNHAAAGFPQDCELCHTTSTWFGAVFDHLQFPIYSGEHRQGEVWDTCSDCHPNANNFMVFDCLSCHPQAEMVEEHEEVPGFMYESQACFECHPTGEE